VVGIKARGLFVDDRIIDMAHRAAKLLGFKKQGTAGVRVQVMAEESKILAHRAKSGQSQLASTESPITSDGVASQPVARQNLPVEVVDLPPVQSPPVEVAPVEAAPAPTPAPVPTSQVYIQAGAFSNQANAERVRAHLASIGDITVTQYPVNGRDLFRVRLGPVGDPAQAERLLTQVVRAGYTNARTVTE